MPFQSHAAAFVVHCELQEQSLTCFIVDVHMICFINFLVFVVFVLEWV